LNLILRGMTLDDEPLHGKLTGFFDERGGDIGRSDSATFTLPDPMRVISRIHARISYGERGYSLENVGAANPILHNSRPLSAGMSVPLAPGDEVRIGGYTFVVDLEDTASTMKILRGRTGTQSFAVPRNAPAPAGGGAPPTPLRHILDDDPGATREDLLLSLVALRHAFSAALEHFRPERLEARFAADGPRGDAGVDPWRQYREQFQTISADARDEFEIFFQGGRRG